MGPSVLRRVLSITGGVVFLLAPWLTLGFGTPIAFAVAAGVMRSCLLGLAALGFVVAWIVAFVANGGDSPTSDALFAAGILINWLGGGVLAAIMTLGFIRALYGNPAATSAGGAGQRPITSEGDAQSTEQVAAQVAAETRVAVAYDPALRSALRRRTRRRLAREIVETDPALATELGIGRPDLERGFKDGGLVDVNGVPASVLASLPGFDQVMAERVVAVRERHGGLSSGAELVVHADLPNQLVDRLSDRLIYRPHWTHDHG